jgi:hypothetical protein
MTTQLLIRLDPSSPHRNATTVELAWYDELFWYNLRDATKRLLAVKKMMIMPMQTTHNPFHRIALRQS